MGGQARRGDSLPGQRGQATPARTHFWDFEHALVPALHARPPALHPPHRRHHLPIAGVAPTAFPAAPNCLPHPGQGPGGWRGCCVPQDTGTWNGPRPSRIFQCTEPGAFQVSRAQVTPRAMAHQGAQVPPHPTSLLMPASPASIHLPCPPPQVHRSLRPGQAPTEQGGGRQLATATLALATLVPLAQSISVH